MVSVLSLLPLMADILSQVHQVQRISPPFPFLTNHGGFDVYIAKLDSAGNILWQKMFGGSAIDQAWSVAVTSDSILIAGQSFSTDIPGTLNSGGQDFYILKFGLNGEFTDW